MFKKTQINSLDNEQLNIELGSLNLDIDGGLGQKRKRLREALYPTSQTSNTDSSQSSSPPQSAHSSVDSQDQQTILSDYPNDVDQ